MFICKECLEENYENEFMPWVPSYGPCEICKKVDTCEDIPSKFLISKKK
jgi:hypothetical protein